MDLEKLSPGMTAILGIPSDANSSFLRGAALAPARIREVLHAGSMNLFSESGINIGNDPRVCDIDPVSPDFHIAGNDIGCHELRVNVCYGPDIGFLFHFELRRRENTGRYEEEEEGDSSSCPGQAWTSFRKTISGALRNVYSRD